MRFRLIVLCLLGCALASASVVTNGGLEGGPSGASTTVPSWTIGGSGGANTAGLCSVIDFDAHSGSCAVGFFSTGPLGSLSQTLSTVAGQTYTLSFWLWNNQPGSNFFEALFNGAQVFSETNSNAHGFEFHSVSVTATGTSTVLQFNGFNVPGTTMLDDVDVSAVGSVPEPATFGLVSGAVLLGGAIRRRLGRK